MTELPRHPGGPRTAIAKRLDVLDTKRATSFAAFIQLGDGGPIPCWGAIAEQFDAEFTEDDERMVVLSALIEEGDRRALLLFLHLARPRPAILARMARRARKLPLSVQRALISLPEAEDAVQRSLKRFAPSVQAFYRGDAQAVVREHERFEDRIRELLAFRYFVPDTFDPREEPPANTDPDEAA